jgi:hypothetical protein
VTKKTFPSGAWNPWPRNSSHHRTERRKMGTMITDIIAKKSGLFVWSNRFRNPSCFLPSAAAVCRPSVQSIRTSPFETRRTSRILSRSYAVTLSFRSRTDQ